MRAISLGLLLVVSSFLRAVAAPALEDLPRVAIPHDIYQRWFDSFKKSSGNHQDDADIQECLRATYPTMKFRRHQNRLAAAWVTSDQVIVPTFTGGVGGGTTYLCVVNRHNGHWRFDQAYYRGNFD